MPGWLRKIFNVLGATEALGTQPWLFHLLIATDNTIRNMHNHLNDGLSNAWYGAHQVWSGLTSLGYQSAVSFRDIYRHKLPNLWKSIFQLTAWTRTQLKLEWTRRISGDNAVRHYALSIVASLTRWVLLHILAPLLTLAAKVTWYIVNRLNPLFDLVMHPDKLAHWILAALIQAFELSFRQIAGPLGRFFLALFVHNLAFTVSTIEDIIVSVL